MLKRDIFLTGLTLPSDIAPEDIDNETVFNAFFTEKDNNMVLQILMPFELVKNMKINDKFSLSISKIE